LLSVTFPFLIFYAEFLKYWPLAIESRPGQRGTEKARSTTIAS